ncbi:MAG TPA: TIGR04283 family arsenosugar biosynthesis glycosyltransferase [Stellaceae bacterium]|nr:TIGR04283 family arsenosugar biosynthesis glycosyltransferase [Stellaceae bacterium]
MRTLQEQISLSIVIPTLNAAGTLADCLQRLAGCEIVVADGGSADATVAVARGAGATVVEAPRGRGSQLAAGAEPARGEWLLFLHADCRLEAGWREAVRDFCANEDRAGYFALALDDKAPAARRVERLVAWRSRVLGLPYGDQGLLISRRLYDSAGGYAPIPLMEDVELARRLGRRRLAPIGATVTASARRYREGGYVARPLRNLACLGLYFAGVAPRRIARLYG